VRVADVANVANVLRVTNDGSLLIGASNYGSGMLAYDLTTGLPAWPRVRAAGSVFVIDERTGVVWATTQGNSGNRVHAFDLATGEPTGVVRDGQHGAVCDVQADRAGRVLALSSCDEGTISLWSLDGGTATAGGVAGAGWFMDEGSWLPDGSIVVHHLDAGTVAIDLETGAHVPFPDIAAGPTDFAPDGRRIRFEFGADRIVVEAPGSAPTRFEILLPDWPWNWAWDPTYTVVGLVGPFSPTNAVTLIDVRAGRVMRTIEPGVGGVLGLSFSPDGRRSCSQARASGPRSMTSPLASSSARSIAPPTRRTRPTVGSSPPAP
jgi:WD40 repeat protein